ncbi:AAA family ATPase [Nibricoccus sp. IMCC34717]|uniref:AAA family ATPase n=1 Tax=Nibricoccus sp. IMCC34717 TaxID=3034021 RepID=UPI00384D23C3
MIESIHFRNFRALRDAHLRLTPFNVAIGPNGSGKTSLIDALLRLRTLSRLPLGPREREVDRDVDAGPQIQFRFGAPYEGIEASLSCVSESFCDFLEVSPMPTERPDDPWPTLRQWLGRMRAFNLDHEALASRAPAREGAELMGNGANLAAVLARIQRESPDAFARINETLCRLFVEYSQLHVAIGDDGSASFTLALKASGTAVAAPHLSQGTLYGIALVTLAFDPRAPSLVAIEEIDRGIHPRLFRRVVDVLYALSHPESRGLERAPTQVIVTTHSPYVLDQFRDHPEEVVISSKQGEAAVFERLSDRPDLLTAIGESGTLGDLWYAGLFGGVPEDPDLER